jgi:hypothetical protein
MAGRWWQLVVFVGIVAAIGEGLLAISDPGVIVFAAIFAAGAALAYRRKLAGVILVGLMSLIEVVFIPFYPRGSTSEVLVQLAFGVLGIVGVVAAAATVRERRRRAVSPA